jgi:hypothetical protein
MGQAHQVHDTLCALCSSALQVCSRLQKVEGADSVFAAGMDDPRSVVIQVRRPRACPRRHRQPKPVLQWYLPGSNEQFSYPIVETDFEFQVYTVDITSYIGSSVQGDATKLVIPSRFKPLLSIIRNVLSFSQLFLASTALLFAPAARHVPPPTADRVLRSAQQRARAHYARADVMRRFPLCPRQYLTDCTEATMDIAKLQKVRLRLSCSRMQRARARD